MKKTRYRKSAEKIYKRDKKLVDTIIDDRSDLTEKEKKKRKRAVKKTKVLFRAIDILFRLAQNSCPFINKDNINVIDCEQNIVYDEALPEICKLDFYRFKSQEKLPAVILIHGGGFTAGDKKYRKGRAQFFALNGFAVFCINYGLAPDYIYPEPLKHIVSAANYIYGNAEEFNIDTDKILVDGDSSGAYYASMLAAFNCSEKLKQVFGWAPGFKIFGALLNCGVYDIDTVLETKYPFKIEDGVLLSLAGVRSADFDNYEYKDVCIPIDFVDDGYPPVFLVFSESDIFCGGQGDVMLDKLNEKGIYCEYYCAHDAMSNHCFSLTWNGNDASAANELTMSFAKRLVGDKIKL